MASTNELIITPEFRMVFPNLFEPSAPKGVPGNPEPMYSLVMLFSHEDAKQIKETMVRLAKAKWGDNVDLSRLQFSMKDGAQEKQKAEQKGKDGSFYDGKIVVKANSRYQPGIVGPDKNELLDKQAIYSGCYGRAELNIVAYDGPGNSPDGCKAYVNFVMKTRDGQRIAGRTAKDVFADVEGASTHEDPTSSSTDGLPI